MKSYVTLLDITSIYYFHENSMQYFITKTCKILYTFHKNSFIIVYYFFIIVLCKGTN